MSWFETRIPPPLVMLLLGCIAWMFARWMPAPWFTLPAHGWIAGVCVAAGLALNLWPKLEFRHAQTTVNPLDPSASTALVTTGVYRYTRNPMYLGHSVILLGWAWYLQHVAAFVAVGAFVVYVTRFQIVPEERMLAGRFPDRYADFRRRVRRWV